MGQEPKKRHSTARKGKRRNHIHLDVKESVTCQNCGQQHVPHKICGNCGYYKGEQFLNPKTKSANN